MKRLLYYLSNYPKVIKRWLIHFIWILFPKTFRNAFPPQSVIEWFADLFFYTIDLLWIPWMYEVIFLLLKNSVRRLNEHELEEGQKMFGNSIRYDLILFDDNAWLGVGKGVLAYVTFFMINFKLRMSMPVFIHELVHVWQFQQFGSVYISKAIKAQRSKEGYNYGGTEKLYAAMVKGLPVTSFNFEQQAEIMEDYYRKYVGRNTTSIETNVYIYFVGMIRESNSRDV